MFGYVVEKDRKGTGGYEGMWKKEHVHILGRRFFVRYFRFRAFLRLPGELEEGRQNSTFSCERDISVSFYHVLPFSTFYPTWCPSDDVYLTASLLVSVISCPSPASENSCETVNHLAMDCKRKAR